MSQLGKFINAGSIGAVGTITGDVGGAVGPDGVANINIVGSGPILVTGNPGAFTLTISISDATTSAVGVVELATNAETIAGADTTRAIVPSGLTAKLGVQTTNGIPYGAGTASAFGWTGAGTDGQLVIAATAGVPAFASLTSSGGFITFTPGANSLDLNVAGSVAVSFDGDVGTATPALGVLNIVGGTGISTSGAGSTITITNDNIVDQDQIIYFGKHGNDGNDGFTIEKAKLTIGAAITAASALTPGAANRIAVVGFDDGIYTENITLPQYVDLNAPNITITGSIVANDDTCINIGFLNVATGVIGVSKTTGTGYCNASIKTIVCTGTGVGALATAGFINIIWKQIFVENGIGFGDLSTAVSHMHLTGGDIYITGSGVGVGRINAGSIVGRVDHIVDIDAGVGTAIAIISGTVDINVSLIDTDTAYNIAGASSILRLFCNEIIGTRTVTGGATSKVWVPPTEMLDGELVIGSTGVDPVVSTLTAGTNINITNGAGSITVNSSSEFTDDVFRILDDGDNTKELAFECSPITTSTVRTWTVDDRDIDFDEVATTYTTDSGNATASGGTITFAGGTNVTTSGSGSTVTINASGGGGGGITWSEVTGTSQAASVDNGYITNNAGLVTVTLPDTAALGSVIRICGKGAGGWKVGQNAGESIIWDEDSSTTTGTGGSLASTDDYDAVELLCTTADTTWTVISSKGNITIV